MKIGWATPRVQRSAIGRVSIVITDLLQKIGHDVTLIGLEWERPEGEPLHASNATTVFWRDLTPDQMRADFDMIVVNVGDNFLFHGGIFHLLDHAPCVGIFHDFYLYNLFRGWLAAHGLSPEVAQRTIVDTYGAHAKETARLAVSETLTLAASARSVPMTEWIGRRCIGALAHAEFYANRLLASCAGPVSVADLPFQGRGVGELPKRDRSQIVALTVGVMNPNKCVDRVIEALGSDGLQGRIEYRLAGPIEDGERQRLEEIAADVGIKDLTILGSVSDQALRHELENADLICCLRNPVLEGASGSAIEGLLSGRPLIVSDAGFYAGLPDALVCKVPADIPIASLAEKLRGLADDEDLRRTMGAKAREWATATFRSDRYVERLTELMNASVSASAALDVGRTIGAELRSLGVPPTDAAVARIGETLDELFALPAHDVQTRAARSGAQRPA